MRIRDELRLGFATVLLMVLVLAGLLFWSLQQRVYQQERTEFAYTQGTIVKDLYTHLNRQLKEVSNYLVLDRDENLDKFDHSSEEIIALLSRWETLIASEIAFGDNHKRVEETTEGRVFGQTKQFCFESLAGCRKALALKGAGQDQKAQRLWREKLEPRFDKQFEELFGDVIAGEEDEIRTVHEAAHRAQILVSWLSIGIVGFAVVVTALVAWHTIRRITKPITCLRDAMIRVGQGDWNTSLDLQGNDEIGELTLAFKQMAEDMQKTTTSVDSLNCEIQHRNAVESTLAETNRTLEETVTKLQRSNTELRNLAHVTAHDLKTPLRAIGTLTDWMLSDGVGELNTQGREYIELLKQRVRTMDCYVDRFQQYTAIGAKPKDIGDVDLQVLVTALVGNMTLPQDVQVDIQGPLPIVECSAGYTRTVFKNLIDNATRFMDKQDGRVEVVCCDKGNVWEFSITDNGPGIESRYTEQIFEIFSTLAPKDETGTTGMGLPVAKKIVEKHGGIMWVESEPGQGSTFFFTLPKVTNAVSEIHR
ncbi:ATP-binding protein [Planctomycetota bacterium]